MAKDRANPGHGRKGLIACAWDAIRRRGLWFSLVVFVVGGAVGLLGWGGFNWALDLSNKEEFCISCHEMESTVYQELKETIHYTNPSGVRATCSDCHVPKEWVHKVARKISATVNELPLHLIGALDTKEKFEAKRLELAKRVWASMEKSDSRECRNCHLINSMAFADQSPRARAQHEDALTTGETCIDCHKGIAHKDVSKQLEPETAPAEESFTID